MSRTIDALAADADRALAAINTARAAARARAWALAGADAPDHGIDADRPLVIDLDATLVTAHSDKEGAAPTFKRGFGHHPLWAFLDHGADGTGEPLAFLLRPGNAGSNTAADHITVTRAALAQLPGTARDPAGSQGPGPHRRRRLHARVPGLDGRAAVVLLGRVHPAHRLRDHAAQDPGSRRGHRPTTPTAASVTVRGSPRPPACWTSPRGRRGCG